MGFALLARRIVAKQIFKSYYVFGACEVYGSLAVTKLQPGTIKEPALIGGFFDVQSFSGFPL